MPKPFVKGDSRINKAGRPKGDAGILTKKGNSLRRLKDIAFVTLTYTN